MDLFGSHTEAVLMRQSKIWQPLGRRAFLKDGALLLAATTVIESTASPGRIKSEAATLGPQSASPLRFAMVTDLHYANKPPAGSRHYRETPAKLTEAAEQFRQRRPDFLVELGDLIDAADSVELEMEYLERIDQDFSAIAEHRHYVLGNHCVDTLTKEEFLGKVGQARSFDSFDLKGYHFVKLDSCFRHDGTPYQRKNFEWTDPNIPAQERDWLRADLAETARPTIVFAHQRLDVGSPYGVKNAQQVRQILEESKKVLAVFQGHSHKNDYQEIGGIHYCTLVALVEGSGIENNGYAIAELDEAGTILIHGFRRQATYNWHG